MKAKAFTSMTPAEKKIAASMKRKIQAKPKAKTMPVIFDLLSPIYFCKNGMTKERCYECRGHFKEGDAYRNSRCGYYFRHVDCEKVKG